MSWSATFTLADVTSEPDYGEYPGNPFPQVGYAEDESKDAILTGIDYARKFISDGLAGANGPYKVELSGHANPDGVPEPGWATDTISVRVTGAMPPKEATA